MPPTLFVNDGSFMERFKQLQQKNSEKDKEKDKGATSEEPKSVKIVAGTSIPHNTSSKTNMQFRGGEIRKTAPTGKLAFSLKQKSKLVAPSVKLGADEDEEESDVVDASDQVPEKRQKLGPQDGTEQPAVQSGVGNYYFILTLLSCWDQWQVFITVCKPINVVCLVVFLVAAVNCVTLFQLYCSMHVQYILIQFLLSWSI